MYLRHHIPFSSTDRLCGQTAQFVQPEGAGQNCPCTYGRPDRTHSLNYIQLYNYTIIHLGRFLAGGLEEYTIIQFFIWERFLAGGLETYAASADTPLIPRVGHNVLHIAVSQGHIRAYYISISTDAIQFWPISIHHTCHMWAWPYNLYILLAICVFIWP